MVNFNTCLNNLGDSLMKYKTILMASIATAMFAGAANAADITSPFYLPGEKQILSNTSLETTRLKLKHHQGTAEDLYLKEELSYGVSNDMAIVGAIGNHFNFKNWSNEEYNNEHNFDYTLGVKHNYGCGKTKMQFGAAYYTYDPRSWYGHGYSEKDWYKELMVEGKLGYEMDNGMLPYTSLNISSPVDQKDRPLNYNWFAGVHKQFGNMSADLGANYEFGTDDKNYGLWTAKGEVNYFVKENMTVGAYGEYFISGNGNVGRQLDEGHTFGLNAKVLF